MNIRNGIDPVNLIFPSPSTTASGVSQGTASASPDNAGLDSAKVSATAGHVATSATEPEVRLDKVASIQNALQSGTYHVPAGKVAEKLIAGLLNSES